MDWIAVCLGSAIGLGLNALRPKRSNSLRSGSSLASVSQFASQSPQSPDPQIPAYQAALDLAQFKSGFLARTSHELRSPMNALISSLQLIQADLCDSPEEEREYIGIAHEAALKFIGLLDEVIKVSKLQTGTLTIQSSEVDLSLLLQDVYFITRLQAETRNLKLIIPPLDQTLLVRADEAYLRQAIVILVDRAVSVLDEGTIELVITNDNDRIYLTIPDPIDPQSPSSPIPGVIPTTFTPEFRRLLAQEILSAMDISMTIQESDQESAAAKMRSVQIILRRISDLRLDPSV